MAASESTGFGVAIVRAATVLQLYRVGLGFIFAQPPRPVVNLIGSLYRSGERCGDWLKWRANRGQEFVLCGYVPNGGVLDSILVGYYDGRDLVYAAGVRAGIPAEFRRVLLPHFEELPI